MWSQQPAPWGASWLQGWLGDFPLAVTTLHHARAARDPYKYPLLLSQCAPSLCSGHTKACLACFPCQIQNLKCVIWRVMVPLKRNKGYKIPQTTTDTSTADSCKGIVLLLLLLWDLSQSLGTFPMVCSASVFALGELCNSEWFTEGENTPLGLTLNMLCDSKSNILGVLCHEDCWVGFLLDENDGLYHISW